LKQRALLNESYSKSLPKHAFTFWKPTTIYRKFDHFIYDIAIAPSYI